MSFTQHTQELRVCFIKAIVSFFIALVPAYYFSEYTIGWIKVSIGLSDDTPLVFLSPLEALWSNIVVSFFLAFVVSFPFMLFQAWKFFSPALSQSERRLGAVFLLFSTFFFLSGLSFAILLVIPFSIKFLLTYKTNNLIPYISIGSLIDFYVKMSISFSIIFELPLVITILSRMGIVTTSFLVRNRKYAILMAFIIAAILTPSTDAMNQLIMAVPLLILYEIGIISARIFG